jgi:hypothetical protein
VGGSDLPSQCMAGSILPEIGMKERVCEGLVIVMLVFRPSNCPLTIEVLPLTNI